MFLATNLSHYRHDPVLTDAVAHSSPDYRCSLASCPYLGRQLLTVVQMPAGDQQEEEVPPQVLLISSTGPSKDHRSFTFGLYELCDYGNNGRPVYKKKGEERFIYNLSLIHI